MFGGALRFVNHLLAFRRYPRLIRQFQLLGIEPDNLVIYGDRFIVKRESLGFLGELPFSELEPQLADQADKFWILMPYPIPEGKVLA